MTRFYHSSIFQGKTFPFLRSFFPAVFAGIVLLAASCQDDGTIIGKDILPGTDFVYLVSTDTLSIYSYTMYTDSLDSDTPSEVFMGQIYDPYFGTTTAGFVTQLRLNSLWDAANSYTVDSVQMLLTFSSVVGDTLAGHVLRISEISDQIYTDTTYYSSTPVNLTGVSVEVPLPVLRSDTITKIYLDLPISFGEYIIRDTSMLFHSDDEPDFRSYFKGLYFQLEESMYPSFITMDITAPGDYETYKHQLYIYMHKEDNSISSLTLTIDAKTTNAAYSTYSHDLSTAEYGKEIQHVNERVKDTLSYVQCLNGIYTKLEIPGLLDLRNDPSLDGVLINKARIVCPVHYDGDRYTGSSFPGILYMGYWDKNGKKYLVPDYYVSSSFYDGTIDTTAGNYNFNIASYVQLFLDDTTGTYLPEFQLALPQGSLKNAILKANGSSDPIKLELTYTKY